MFELDSTGRAKKVYYLRYNGEAAGTRSFELLALNSVGSFSTVGVMEVPIVVGDPFAAINYLYGRTATVGWPLGYLENDDAFSEVIGFFTDAGAAKAYEPTPPGIAQGGEVQQTPTSEIASTPEVKLRGLINDIWRFPKITEEQELEHIQKAIETRSLNLDPEDVNNIQLHQVSVTAEDVYSGVKLTCMIDKSGRIVDSYQVTIQTADGHIRVNKILVEILGTFEDGTRGSVIVPVILDGDIVGGFESYEKNMQNRIDTFIRNIQRYSYLTFTFPTNIVETDARNPDIIALRELNSANPKINELLEKANRLAEKKQILTQAEWLTLVHAIEIFGIK